MIKNKRTFAEIADEHSNTFVRYHKGLKALQDTIHTELRTNDWIKPGRYKWIWGPTGTGKTEGIFKKYKPDEIFVKDNSRWWDGFDSNRHRVVLLDDFRHAKDGLSFDDLLRIAQPYKYQVPIKGGYTSLGMQDIVVTSNLSPMEMYGGTHDIAPLLRRFHVTNTMKKEMTDLNDSPPQCIDLTLSD